MLNYVHWFFKSRVVFHTLYLWNQVGDSQFFVALLTQVIHYLTAVKSLRKIYWLENFSGNVLNPKEFESGFCFSLLNTEISPISFGGASSEKSTLDCFWFKNPILDLLQIATLKIVCWLTPSIIKTCKWCHHRRRFGHPAEPLNSVRNLGSWFDSNMSMLIHIGKTCSKAFHGLCIIR